MMNRKHWDILAGDFEASVLEISNQDLGGVLEEEVDRLATGLKSRGVAADLGCGPGSLLPVLARKFGTVYGVDFAAKLLEEAGRRCEAPNLRLLQHSLTGGKPLPFKADVSFCVNALINPRAGLREKMLRAVRGATKKGGRCVFVVPALESTLHTFQAMIRCRVKEGAGHARELRLADGVFKEEVLSPVGGIVDIGSVATKCFLREELVTVLEDARFAVERIRKIEFSWDEEIENAPDWLKAPYPWDWLVVARKR